MTLFLQLLGHKNAYHLFCELAERGMLHHAWLLTGLKGIGKRQLANAMAVWLLADKGKDTSELTQIVSGAHPDYLVVERRIDPKSGKMQAELLVDDVRAIGKFMRMTPAKAGWRVVIVDEVSSMNRNAANALLKILEEPPNRSILILTSSLPGKLLSTIISRCRKLTLNRLPDADVERIVLSVHPSILSDKLMRIVKLAKGSAGRALSLVEPGKLEISDLVDKIFKTSPKGNKTEDIIDKILAQSSGFEEFFMFLSGAISDYVHTVTLNSDVNLADKPLSQKPVAEWIEIWQTLRRLEDRTKRFNLEYREALIEAVTLVSTP